MVLDYPKGGTEALVDALVRGVEGKGGKVMLGTHVEEVVVEDGKACGVRLRGGKVVRASRYYRAPAPSASACIYFNEKGLVSVRLLFRLML